MQRPNEPGPWDAMANAVCGMMIAVVGVSVCMIYPELPKPRTAPAAYGKLALLLRCVAAVPAWSGRTCSGPEGMSFDELRRSVRPQSVSRTRAVAINIAPFCFAAGAARPGRRQIAFKHDTPKRQRTEAWKHASVCVCVPAKKV